MFSRPVNSLYSCIIIIVESLKIKDCFYFTKIQLSKPMIKCILAMTISSSLHYPVIVFFPKTSRAWFEEGITVVTSSLSDCLMASVLVGCLSYDRLFSLWRLTRNKLLHMSYSSVWIKFLSWHKGFILKQNVQTFYPIR